MLPSPVAGLKRKARPPGRAFFLEGRRCATAPAPLCLSPCPSPHAWAARLADPVAVFVAVGAAEPVVAAVADVPVADAAAPAVAHVAVFAAVGAAEPVVAAAVDVPAADVAAPAVAHAAAPDPAA